MAGVASRASKTREKLSWNLSRAKDSRRRNVVRTLCAIFGTGVLLAALIALVPGTLAQNTSPRISAVDPASGKVNDTVTATGTNLGKASVAGVFLSDDKSDFKATLVEQADEKLVFKVPQVKPGPYNLSVQVGAQILILPVHFTVE
jgi:hypothetical protein